MSNRVKINVQAKPSAKEETIEKLDDTHFVISVTEPPIQGRANRAIIALIANYFNIKSYQVQLISGATSKQKVFEVQI